MATELEKQLAEALRDLKRAVNWKSAVAIGGKAGDILDASNMLCDAVDAADEALAAFDAKQAAPVSVANSPQATDGLVWRQKRVSREIAAAVYAYQAASEQPAVVPVGEREAFEAKFGQPPGLTWDGSEYQCDDGWENCYATNAYLAKWDAWQACAAIAQQPAALKPATVPHPGSPEAKAMIDSELALRDWPASHFNAARAGYEACRKLAGLGIAQPERKQP